MLNEEIIKLLSPDPLTKKLIITIGNPLRADDAVGPYIAEKAINSSIPVFNAGERPEDSLDVAEETKPDHVIFIDAADFGGEVGEARTIDEQALSGNSLSTHIFPIPVVAKLIQQDTKAKITFIGIQPQNVALGGMMSDKVRSTAMEIINLINY